MAYDLVIKNGRLITAHSDFTADVAVSGESIAAIGRGLSAAREIDAAGCYVLPGAIDGHLHFTDPTFPPYAVPAADSFATGSRAGAFGGVTTVIDFAQPAVGQPLLEELDRRLADAAGQSVIDYGLHLNLRDPDPARLAEIPAVFQRGVPSFKLYTAYPGYRLPDAAIFLAMQQLGKLGGLAVLHAEDDDLIEALRAQFAAEGKTGPRWHAAVCPPAGEAESIQRVAAYAQVAGVRLLVFHISCGEGVDVLRQAKARGQAVYGEAVAHNLVLTDEALQADTLFAEHLMVRPPIRDGAQQAALWRGLADGGLDIVSTDHCPRVPVDGVQPRGAAGIETRLALMHHFGVRAGRLSLPQWVAACCTRPAEIFDLPRKGRLNPGCDADLVIFDPERVMALEPENLHSPLPYSTYTGITVQGFPVTTISRGEVIVDHGQWLGQAGRGRFLERGR